MKAVSGPLAPVAGHVEPLYPTALLLTVEEAAAVLTIGKTKMYELIKAGVVPARYIGRRRVIAVVDLHCFIDDLPTEPAA